MNKKKAILTGLMGMITVSVFGAAFMANTDSLIALSVNSESGAKVDRNIVVTDFVRRGYYVKASSGRVSDYDETVVSFELSNPGTYGYLEVLCKDVTSLTNIDDGFINFRSENQVLRILSFNFEDNCEFYDSQAASTDPKNKLPIYNFAKKSVSSIVIKMGSRNEGEITGTDYYDVAYDSDTKSYTISGLDNCSAFYVYSLNTNAYFHIESITINYNC